MAKIINSLDIDLSSLAASGEVRDFLVKGDDGAIFSLEVKNEDGYYYNFTTNTFGATKARLKRKAIADGGVFSGNITFPSVGDNDQYDIYLFAESHFDTAHKRYEEVRFGDGSLDINSSSGSGSNLLQKVIYQYTDTTITIQALSPLSTYRSTGDFASMSVSNATVVVGRGNNVGRQSFSISLTTAATKACQILRQPAPNDFFTVANSTYTSPVEIPGENIWAGAARSTDTVDGDFSGGTTKIIMDTNVADKMVVGDRVTGTGISSSIVLTVVALNPDEDNVKEFSVTESVEIDDGVTLTFTPPYYYRYYTDHASGGGTIHNLISGMPMYDPDLAVALFAGTARIASYEDTTTYTTETVNEDGSVDEVTNVEVNVSIPPLDTAGHKPTISNGLVTQQKGNITFDRQIINDSADSETKAFFGYGREAIKIVNKTDIILSNLKVELTKPTTTTTSSVSNSATIPVADREGTIANVSTISGIGIASGAANPTITSSTADGAGSWTASVAQTLESGITLTVEGSSRTAVITGEIEVVSCNDSNFSLYVDVDRFLDAS